MYKPKVNEKEETLPISYCKDRLPLLQKNDDDITMLLCQFIHFVKVLFME